MDLGRISKMAYFQILQVKVLKMASVQAIQANVLC